MPTSAQQRFMDFERSGWNEVAATYAAASQPSTPQIAATLLDAAGVVDGTRLLDVASGPGWTAAAAAERGAEVTGLDVSTAMVEGARRRFPDIRFEEGAGESMPFDDATFDAVVSAFGMPHFADHAAVFAEAHRVLRPGGRLAVASWNPPASNPFFAVALGAIGRAGRLDVDLPEGVDMFTWADDDVCHPLFAGAGFGPHTRLAADITVETDDGPAMVLEVLENASVRSRALYRAQTDEARAAIAEEITELMAPMESEGTWRVVMSAFVLVAERS